MTEARKARKFIVDFLRKEIVGPTPGDPDVQLDEKILRTQDPPRKRYGAGVLFPIRAQVLRQEEMSTDEDFPEGAESPELDQAVETSKLDDSVGTKTASNDSSEDTDEGVKLANEFLPSAMGLSALLDNPRRLLVDVSAAIYRHQDIQQEELQPEKQTDKGGRKTFKAWRQEPINRSIELSPKELLRGKPFYKTVFEKDGDPALVLHVLSRHMGSQQSRLITFTLVNRLKSDNRTPKNSACFFQCSFSVRELGNKACFLSYPERGYDDEDSEELSLRLLYRHQHTFAVGHGCAPEWEGESNGCASLIRTEVLPKYEIRPVLPTKIEGLDLQMGKLMGSDTSASTALCGKLADEYEQWIAARERETNSQSDLPLELKGTAHRHIKDCRECLRRMRDGTALLTEDPDSALAFRLMNEAMLMQSVHYKISSKQPRKWKEVDGKLQPGEPFVRPRYMDPKHNRHWWPFQLAFILMNLRAVADPHCLERDIVDVIWFPTGGGKTEAYLGLSAFSMFLRRLRNPKHAGTSILMRYTLRLLTIQQFQRAASLICACEFIRRREVSRLGSECFSIGLWVGTAATPNSEKDAVEVLRKLDRSEPTANKFILLHCPWCGAGMGPQKFGKATKCIGYRKLAHPNRVRHICDDPDCDFSSNDGLPLAVIDEHIYKSPPTLLIGTVDKFAMLAFRPEARRLFGIDTPYPPPELIIQDELHLISGPLGSMVGHYETVVNALCINKEEKPAKIIASTATISRARDQVKSLYGRDTFLFPPQALKAGDSFFAEESEDIENEMGRLYVGVFASALTSHVTAQVRTMSALLQAPKLFSASTPKAVDPYWTLMGYFNSLRELGHAATLIQADIREYLNATWGPRGLRHSILEDSPVDRRRFIGRYEELTSRIQSDKIPEILDKLFHSYDGSKKSEVVDVCFATNMIQVGLDVPRLGLMTIIGQPKTTAEYIQASSRIGRTNECPGIVVTNYNPAKPRDRSHYEHFRSHHQAIYRYIEPTSVTPYAIPVRERALHALIVILYRFWGSDGLHERPGNPLDHPELLERIKRVIRKQVKAVDPGEWSKTNDLIDRIVHKWSKSPPFRYGGFGSVNEEIPLMHPAGSPQHPDWEGWPFETPRSMRNVDADCSAHQLKYGYCDESDDLSMSGKFNRNRKPIKRGQLIAPLGVGALVNVHAYRGDESWMTAGLDEWPFARDRCPEDWCVQEERLQARLNMTHFRLPPEFREKRFGVDTKLTEKHIPFVRFPQWHYCPNCRAMERLTFFNGRAQCRSGGKHGCGSLPKRKRPWLIPSRFITVCPKGHIEDFPFMEWVHKDGNWSHEHKCDQEHKLRLLRGNSPASLSDIRVRCSCGKSEAMIGTFNFDTETGGALRKIGYGCSESMPWLGVEGKHSKCSEHLRVVQRGASNVYFPLTMSSIHLPPGDKKGNAAIKKILDNPKVWSSLTGGLDDGKYIQAARCETVSKLRHGQVDPEGLRKAAQIKFDGTPTYSGKTLRSKEGFRRQEYEALRAGRGDHTTDLLVEKCELTKHKQKYEFLKLLERLCVVKKLRETRVLLGFSRLLPFDVEDSSSTGLLPMSKNKNLRWLPATVVYGEGVFFEFNAKKLDKWLENPEVKNRVRELSGSYNKRRSERGLKAVKITAKYVLLHTFSHVLINQLSFDCGYGGASLRERIYCERDDLDQPMQGVLIYTASGDSEGTLGGLVRQGEPNRMGLAVKRAIIRAKWCSSDPVCIESKGQGSDNANLAACHSCVLLPETSCETGNRLLDRALIVGTTGNPDIGFFSHLAR